MKKRLLLVGGKFADIPTIKSAKRMGYYVITSGNNPNDLGHKFADEVALCDYSNKEAMLELAKSFHIDALMPSCDDVSALTCAYIAENIGIGEFDNMETYKIIHYKNLWRKFMREHNLPSPKALGFDDLQNALKIIPKEFGDSKIIIKPTDFAAGKGVSVTYANNNLRDSLTLALQNSKNHSIIVEEFLEGSNHGFSTILLDKKVIFYFADDEQHDFNEFAVSGTTTSFIFNKEIVQDLITQIEKVANALNLKNGIFHTQIKLCKTKDNSLKPYIIEACRRFGGDLYAEFVSQSCGIDYPRICLELHNNLKLESIYYASNIKLMDNTIDTTQCRSFNDKNIPYLRPKKYFARQCVMSSHIGTLKDINLSYLQPYLIDKVIWAKQGDRIENTKTYKAGIVFLEFQTLQDMQRVVGNLDKLIVV